MSVERRGPAICNVSNTRVGEDEMTKTSNDSQDLKRRICVKAKAELLRRFWSIRSYAQERQGLGWERWSRQSRKSPQQDRSHKPRREANGRAQCGKSACCVRCGGGWRRGLVERHLGQSRRASPRPYRRARVCSHLVSSTDWYQKTFASIRRGTIRFSSATGGHQPQWTGRLDHSGMSGSIGWELAFLNA